MIAPNYTHFRNLFAYDVTSTYARDGMLEWPEGDVSNAITSITSFTQTFPISVDLAGADDAVAYRDEWDWYLQVPNEGSGNERIELRRYDTSTTASRSGRVRIYLTALGASDFTKHDSEWMSRLMRNVYLYAKEISSGEIWFCDVHRAMFASV